MKSLLVSLLGLLALGGSIGAPVFSALTECPSIRVALDDGRQYVDFRNDVRLRLSAGGSDGEVALRGLSAFEANETIQRAILDGQSLTMRAVDAASEREIVEVFTKSNSGRIDFVAVYHRDNGALVVSSFDGESPRCERLGNEAASAFVADLSQANNAGSGVLSFVSSDAVYARLGL
jgi:hypothetical protein